MADPIIDREWELVGDLLPDHGCGLRLQPGWGPNSPVAVCRPCTAVYRLSIDGMARLLARARTLAAQETTG